MPPRTKKTASAAQASDYRHAEQALARPDAGTQPQFKKRAAPKAYRYDSSIAPAHDTANERKATHWFETELLGLDVFDPATMQVEHRRGDDVLACLLDTDYNALSSHVCQAFIPRTAAWDNLKRALKGEFEDSVWQHLAGAVCVPFEAGQLGQLAVKVIGDRGNELMVVQALEAAK